MKNKKKKIENDLLEDAIIGIGIFLMVLLLAIASSCTTPQMAAQQDLQPTETHDVLIDRATGEQYYVLKDTTWQQ